jgi:dTMP kinase
MKYHVDFEIELKKHETSGTYIAIEGIDGCGKTTQVTKLLEHFKNQGKDVLQTREPSRKGLVGELVHNILLAEVKVPAVALQYLFAADRAINQQEVILPALKSGKCLIADRCFWSALPYGIVDRSQPGKPIDYESGNVLLTAYSILSLYHQFTAPDKTFYLKISVDTAMKRLLEENKQKEIYDEAEKLEKICNGYEWLAQKFPDHFVVIDGEQSVDQVTAKILESI